MLSLSYTSVFGTCGTDTFDLEDKKDWRENHLMLGVPSVCEVF